jgi:2-(1,2-epoxy-1,2-dihydrophenyl)acetyl-CoA isomerase
MYEFLTYSKSDGIGTLKLNRPEVYNAFNDGLTNEIQKVIKEVGRDKEVRVLVITGEGKAFSSGQDLKDAASQPNRSFSKSIETRYNPIIRGLRNLPKPVICQLNGVAAGAGCSMVLACDIIIASSEAYLMEVFVNIGLVLDSGSSYFLPRLVGYTKAFEWSTMANKISATEAEQWGIVTKVVPTEQLDDETLKYAEHYAHAPTKAIGLIKKMLQKSYHSNLDEMLDYEAMVQDIAGASYDHQEGIKSFMEKRKPEFRGE